MADQELKSTIVVAAEDQTKSTFQDIKSGAADMASSVQQSGEKAAKGIEGIGNGADNAAQKLTRAEGSIAQALQRATEKTKIAAQAGESLSRAFEQKIELRGLDASKLNPFVQQLREAENALAAVKAQQAQAAGQNAFLDSLRSQTEVIGKTKTELLELKAAQLGMSTAAAPYIAKLKEAEVGIGKVGMSAAQTANAMRMVPAQFTDIVVSLQSGQAPLTVLLQQGGQLKDMFGTAGAAARGMATYVIRLVTPYTAAAAAVALLGLAYYQGSKEVDAYRKSLVLSGNQIGTSIDQLNAMARAMADSVGTQGRAAAGLAEMAQKSKVGSDNLKEFTTSAIQWEKATGQAVSETAKQFADLANDPLKAALALNDQMNFLTASVYDQIKALDEQGKKEEAAAVAQKAYSDAMKSRSSEVVQNLGYVERAYKAVGGAAAWAWDQIAGIGRPTTPMDDAAKHIERMEKDLALRLQRGPTNSLVSGSHEKGNEDLRRRIQQAKDFLGLMTSADTFVADQQKSQKDYVDAMEEFNRGASQFASKEVKRKQELTVAENQYKKAVEETKKTFAGTPELAEKLADLESKHQKRQEGINKRFAENSGSGSGARRGENELANIRALIAQEDEMIQRYQTRGAAAEKMTDAEKLLSRLESQRAETSNKTIRAEKERAIVEAQKLVAKQAYRKELEAAAKAEEDQNEANRKSIEAMLKSAAAAEDEAERIEASLQVYGKARTEIERLTLAKLEQKKVDMDGASSEAMVAIQARIDAQRKLVESLQKLDYKKLDDKLTKSLELSKEELAIQQDGLSLLGLDETMRKKVVAQRRIDLELAKQIAEIDRAKFSDNEEENEQQKEALRQKARLKSEADTQTAVLKIQEEYINQQVQQYDDIFRRGFADMLNNGKDGWDSFTKSLTTTFKTTVADQIYKMFLRPFVVKVVAQMVGMTGASQELPGTGVAGGSGLTGGSLTDWSNWGNSASSWASDASFKMVSNGWTEMGSSMMGLSRTITSVDSYLKTIPGMSGGIGSAAGYLGSIYALTQGQYGTGLGSAIGTAILPGIGTMIGGALGGLLDGAFGHKSTQEYGGSALYSAANGAQQTSQYGAYGIGLSSAAYDANILANVSGISKSIVDALDATAKTFGRTVGYEAAAGFATDFGDEATWGALRISLGGSNIVNWQDNRQTRWAPKEFASGEEGYKQYLNAVALDVKGALLAMDLPTWADQLVSAATDLDTINAALQQIGTVKAVFDGLGQSMQMFSGISGELQTQLLQTAGSMDALASNAGAFYEGFFSEQERMDALQKQLRESLSGLDLSIDPSMGEAAKEQFRATVEAAMSAGQGELAAKLLALSGSFATAADYAQKAFDDIAKAAQEAVKAAQEAAKAAADARLQIAQGMWDAAMANLNAAVEREKSYWQGIESSAQKAVSSLSSTLGLLTSNARELYGSVDSTQQMLAAQGMVYIESALSAVRGGKSVTGFDKLQDAISAARGGISGGAYATQFERDRDALVLAGQLSELGDLTDSQLSVQNRQLKAAQEQISQLDKTLAYWQTALTNDGLQLDATMTVAQAVMALGPLLANLQGAKAAAYAPAIVDVTSKSAEEKAALYRQMLGSGLSDAQIRAQVNKTTGLQTDTDWDLLRKLAGIPGYAVGANYIPNNQLAVLHEGEAVIPKAFNPWAGGGFGAMGNTARLEAQMDQLLDDNRRQAGEIIRLNARIARLMERWDGDGMPPQREEAIA